MWELQPFVTNCIAVLNEDGSHRLVREVVPVASPRGLSDRAAVLECLREPKRVEVQSLYRSKDLTT